MLFILLFRFLFAASAYVRYPSELFQERSHFLKIIPFIETHASRNVGLFRPERFERFSKHLEVVPVRSRYGTGKRDAVLIGGQTSFCPYFSSIGGIFAYFFPRRAVPWS